jgi:hypothetical protein
LWLSLQCSHFFCGYPFNVVNVFVVITSMLLNYYLLKQLSNDLQ